MTNWLLQRNTNTIVYLFYSPWILLLFIPFTPFYGNLDKLWVPILIIFLLEISLYHIFTIVIGIRLILLDNGRFTNYTLNGFVVHSIFSIIILLVVGSFLIYRPELIIPRLFIILYLISELYRGIKISNLIVALELEKKLVIKEYLLTLYLVINPYFGLWNLHNRLKKLILKKQ